MTEATQPGQFSDTVSYEVRDGVAVIRLVNPPVNGLGDTVRAGIAAAVQAAGHDESVRGVAIVGDGKGFCGGADIRQFGTPAATAPPMLKAVFSGIQALDKPVLAAIQGFALGGGMELALACHYRIAQPTARLGLPEVNLGIIPGAGGTQRLPRIIGAAKALRLIQQGSPVTGAQGAELGMVDGIFEGDPAAAAVAFLTALPADAALPLVDALPLADAAGVDFVAARAKIRPSTRNGLAQRGAIDAVEIATTTPIEQGLLREREIFEGLVAGPESAALRYMFFAEKEATKIVDLDPSATARDISRVTVIGAGTMGGGISMSLANAGIDVDLVETSEQALDRGMGIIRGNYEASAKKGKLTPEKLAERLGRITPGTDLSVAADADLVIEAIFEEMQVKLDVFAKLDTICPPGTILASNTSRLNIDEIAASTSRPQDVIGLHFFSPANVMRLLEVVRGAATSDEVLVTCMRMAQRIGKIPVVARVCDGFIGNRMVAEYRREADFLIEEGSTPSEVDRTLREFGLAMGPFAMSDLAGLDITWAIRKSKAATRPAHLRYSRVADVLCEEGRFGQKTGSGYFTYDGRTPVRDEHVEEVVRRCAAEDGIEQREITSQEIIDRCILALVNEGAKLLGEGIAQRASDIDVVYVNGYGFPAYRGGPMYYAQTRGLAEVLDIIRSFEKTHGEVWTPAPLLVELVEAGRTSF